MAISELPSQEMRTAFMRELPSLTDEQLVGNGQIVQIDTSDFGVVKISPDLGGLTRATFTYNGSGFELETVDHFTNPNTDKLLWDPRLLTVEYLIK